MKLLVVGSGGREHAIAKKLLESKDVEQVFVAPGNDGMTLDGLDLINIGISEHSKLIDFAKANDIAWTFIGPDDALAAGSQGLHRGKRCSNRRQGRRLGPR